jgi:hypothetical protein
VEHATRGGTILQPDLACHGLRLCLGSVRRGAGRGARGVLCGSPVPFEGPHAPAGASHLHLRRAVGFQEGLGHIPQAGSGALAVWDARELRGDPPDTRVLLLRPPEAYRCAQPLGPAPRLRQPLLDRRRRPGQEGRGQPDPVALSGAHDRERCGAFLRLEAIATQAHGIHVRIRGRALRRIVLASRPPRWGAMDGTRDGLVRPAPLVRLGQRRPDLPDRPVPGEAPTHHLPAQAPPGHGQGWCGFRTEGPGVGRPDTCRTMGQLPDDMPGAMEGAQATMTMIAPAESAPACLAPLLLNGQGEAGKHCGVGPTGCPDRPLLAWDVSDDDHPGHRHYAA